VTKVAIVDDHEALREGLERLLADRGMEVVGSAGSAAAAIELVSDSAPDIAIVDIRLPDGSGIDLTRELIAAHPHLGVVLYTGHADAEMLDGGLDSGARGYALKAGSLSELAGAIESVAAGGRYVDPRLEHVLFGDGTTTRAPQLSPREREVTHLMAEGMTAEDIGRRLGVSVETVRTHVRHVIRKLQARNRVHAIAIAMERGEIALDER
jgi:DNA-binding NarL/FixJ family response regulator